MKGQGLCARARETGGTGMDLRCTADKYGVLELLSEPFNLGEILYAQCLGCTP